MTHARKSLISLDDTPYYHCISRCVRRAFLWGRDEFSGRDYSHRKQWVLDRLAALQRIFAIDLCAYAVMSNHYHVVLRVDRDQARSWSVDEVIERWELLFGVPLAVARHRAANQVSDAERAKALELVEVWRERLHDVSWFMRCLNEYLARRANAEDQCKGRFWEGRFKSQALLDEAGLLTCMSYVDLNPIRAGIAAMPEDSEYTSIYARIRSNAVQRITQQNTQLEALSQTSPTLLQFRSPPQGDDMALPFYLTDYLALVDWTGRAIREDKRGSIPEDLPPILDRLGIDPHHWVKQMHRKRDHFGRALGRAHALGVHARNVGQQWIRGMRLSQQLYPENAV